MRRSNVFNQSTSFSQFSSIQFSSVPFAVNTSLDRVSTELGATVNSNVHTSYRITSQCGQYAQQMWAHYNGSVHYLPEASIPTDPAPRYSDMYCCVDKVARLNLPNKPFTKIISGESRKNGKNLLACLLHSRSTRRVRSGRKCAKLIITVPLGELTTISQTASQLGDRNTSPIPTPLDACGISFSTEREPSYLL